MRLFDFVDAVARLDPLTHQSVGALFHRPMPLTDATNYFDSYRVERLAIDDSIDAVKIELREPRPGSGATGGALMTMGLTGPCVTLDSVTGRYGAARLTSAPRGRTGNEDIVYEVRSGNRAVRFAFNETRPDCLSGLTFEALV